jgi:dCTP deaminase
MILSNSEIHKALDEGRLVISPEPTPRFPSPGVSCPYNTHAVDLKLHNEITVPERGTYSIDLENDGALANLLSKNSQKCTLTKSQPYKLEPNQFILCRTVEKIILPVDPKNQPNLAARIEGKSSRARCGILIHFTAPTVHPGFEGNLTLEMINLGPVPFILTPNMYIAQLIVEEVRGNILLNPSQFQGQITPEGK